MNKIVTSDALDGLRALPDCIADMCVTSPPYYGLRDYGIDGQIGLEKTPDEYIQKLIEVFREVRRVLRNDGTLWVNIADSYAGSPGGSSGGRSMICNSGTAYSKRNKHNNGNAKPKDLIGIPWMLAFALRADGWYLRQDIIWHKPNPLPESVADRCTKSHEYIFLLSKSSKYYFDAEAISEPIRESTVKRLSQNVDSQVGSCRIPGKTNGAMKAVLPKYGGGSHRNKRSVWTVTTQPYTHNHFAVFPPSLIRPCVLAGSRLWGIVLDPFLGSGTTAVVAKEENRNYLGIEINPEYVRLANKRIVCAMPKLLFEQEACG